MNADSLLPCGSRRRRGPAISLWLYGNVKFDTVSHNGDGGALCWWVSSYRSVLKSLSSCSVERDVRKVHRTKDFNCFSETANFVELLNSQQDSVFHCEASNFGVEKGTERKERRAWTHSDDVVLISAWLNTSKDLLVGNEQCSGAFWKRIAAFYAASPNIAPGEEREANQCKHHWHKINDQVSKFSGSYAAATREKTSGQNEVDVIKHAHEIFYNNYKKKFTLEHVWRELRYDQKWCGDEGGNKRKNLGDGSHSASESVNAHVDVDDDGTNRPPGVKAAKASGKKKPMVEGKEVSDFHSMWELKKEDLVRKERVVKLRLLDKLLGKKEPLSDADEGLKTRLVSELMPN